MAIFNGSSKFNSHIVFALDVHEEGINVNENVSYIGWRLIGYMDDSGNSSHWYSYEQNTGYVNLNGNTIWSVDKGAKQSIGTQNRSSNPVVIASGKATFAHNADGSKSINVAFSFGPTWNNKITGSGTLKLSNIPRASSFTLSSSSIEFGGKFNCTITAASSSFRHILKFKANGLGTQTVKSNMGSGTISGITIPSDWMKYCTNKDSMTVGPMLETYKDGTCIGTKSISPITIKVPTNIVPSCSVSVSDATSYNGKYGAYVQGKSTAKVTVTASGSNGSTIKSTTSYVDGITYNGNANYFCSKSGQITYSGKAVDSRGRSKSSGNKTFTVLPYNNPSGSLSVKRVTSTSDSTANENGSAAVITYSYNISSLNSKNSKNISIWNGNSKIKEITDSYSGNGSITISAPSTSSLTIKMYVSDDFNSGIVYTASIPSAFRLINLNNSGKGIAFGKYSENDDFDVNMNTMFRKAVRSEGDIIAGLGTSNQVSLQGLKDDIMSSAYGNGWEEGSYTLKAGQNTMIYAENILKTGVYLFVPSFRTKLPSGHIFSVGIFDYTTLQYPVTQYMDVCTMTGTGRTHCMNGILVFNAVAGKRYYVMGYSTADIRLDTVNWFHIFCLKTT